jgi:hypothetical protein
MIKDYPNLSLKLAAAAILMIASISAVVLLYKDSQKRSLLYSHTYMSNRFSPSEISSNFYPSVEKASNQRANSTNTYPSYKGANNINDYNPTDAVVPIVATTSVGVGTQHVINNQQSTSSANTSISSIQINSTNGSTALTSQNKSSLATSSNLASNSIFSDGNSMGSEVAGNGRMLVSDPPAEPGVPVSNGNYVLILLLTIYGFFKFKNKYKIECSAGN